MVADTVVLDYCEPSALDYIEQHRGELAAVLVEPVQSRAPSLSPAAFLRDLRRVTADHDIALVFDEVITGFRCARGGAQELFGVRPAQPVRQDHRELRQPRRRAAAAGRRAGQAVRPACGPDLKVWRALTDPALMALWSMRPEGGLRARGRHTIQARRQAAAGLARLCRVRGARRARAVAAALLLARR
jgi:hypothetical protein